ncbi:DNA methyltransferase [Streptomyces niveus NCIMB 11891]|nr:DNA methyltransferase [Streptomyces niveus NCIMB 11891]
MSRSHSAQTLPGTALSLPRRKLDDVLAATARPVAPVPGQREFAAVDVPRVASFCTGYGGLDDAVMRVFGGELAWVADNDPGASRIIAHHHPQVPNLGDITVADWHRILDKYGRPDIVNGGYPCQPVSLAGELKGTTDDRWIWPHIARALGVLRPRYAIFENVANHLRIGFDTVLCDLADLGFDVEWDVVRADEVGAPHQRRRLIVLATAQDADGAACDQWGIAAPGQAAGGRTRPDAGGRGRALAADPDRSGQRPNERDVQQGQPDATRGAAADSHSDRRQGQQRSESGVGARSDLDGRRAERWGRYASAVARWEAVTGRRAPWATDDRGRLNPEFVEWMMGLSCGHVTAAPGLSRNEQLKALGNGVVPQQAEAALRMLLARRIAAEPAA